MSFAGKLVFITGVSSGIGAAQAKQFLAEGAIVFGMDIQPTKLVDKNFTFFNGDVCVLTDILAAVKKARELGKIDILVNTAGILDDYKPSLETDEALFDLILTTNLKSMYRLVNAILPDMVQDKSGVIINMASIAGLVAGGGGAAYTAAKHAVVGYTKQLAYDYSKYGIRINAIAPGAIKTPMNRGDFENGGEIARQVAAETPVERWGEPEEVAELTLFLAKNSAAFIQGMVIPIDGGWTIK
ncbi:3-oxoacyl-ACP reductase [Listeria sp. PSOL-1]|uniref:3-oxoacyl-ACP reductase n=1 Tax=Listeria sp. PSOL-1 TaxID=1844999 RepID=UPI0013D75259|nr:3-oxoacyl-ACP reductase [Listeria sp. PSOL-1]